MRCNQEGWDNDIVVVNEEIVFRFPRRADVEDDLRTEVKVIPELSAKVSLRIPSFKYVSQGCSLFERMFVGYRMIPGIELTREVLDLAFAGGYATRLAGQISRFLSELHSFPVSRALELGVRRFWSRSQVSSFYTRDQTEGLPAVGRDLEEMGC